MPDDLTAKSKIQHGGTRAGAGRKKNTKKTGFSTWRVTSSHKGTLKTIQDRIKLEMKRTGKKQGAVLEQILLDWCATQEGL
jgi:hypothetical protein